MYNIYTHYLREHHVSTYKILSHANMHTKWQDDISWGRTCIAASHDSCYTCVVKSMHACISWCTRSSCIHKCVLNKNKYLLTWSFSQTRIHTYAVCSVNMPSVNLCSLIWMWVLILLRPTHLMGRQLLSQTTEWRIWWALMMYQRADSIIVTYVMCSYVQVYRINKTAAEIANRACADVTKSTGILLLTRYICGYAFYIKFIRIKIIFKL